MTNLPGKKQRSMLQIIKSWFFYTAPAKEALPILKQKKDGKPVFNPLNLYRSCNELPLDRFIDCLVDGNLQRLIKDPQAGDIPGDALADAWEEVFEEYAGMMGSSEMDYVLKLVREINIIRLKLSYVQSAIKLLSLKHSPEVCTELRRMGYDLKFNPDNAEGYQRDLQAVTSRSKTMVVQLKQREQEYERYSKQAVGKTKTRADFDKDLIVLSKFQGYRIDKQVTTVTEYAAIFKSLIGHYEKEQLLKQKEATNGRRSNK